MDHDTQEAWRLTYQYDIVEGEAREQTVEQMAATDARVEEQIGLIDAVLAADGVEELNWTAFKASWAEWLAFRDATLMPAVEAKAVTPEIQAANDEIIATYRASLSASGDAVYAYLDTVADDAAAKAARAFLLMIVVAVVGLLLAVVVGVRVANRIRRSAGTVQHALGALASGDLTVRAEVVGRDELGQMAAALTSAQENLRGSSRRWRGRRRRWLRRRSSCLRRVRSSRRRRTRRRRSRVWWRRRRSRCRRTCRRWLRVRRRWGLDPGDRAELERGGEGGEQGHGAGCGDERDGAEAGDVVAGDR